MAVIMVGADPREDVVVQDRPVWGGEYMSDVGTFTLGLRHHTAVDATEVVVANLPLGDVARGCRGLLDGFRYREEVLVLVSVARVDSDVDKVSAADEVSTELRDIC